MNTDGNNLNETLRLLGYTTETSTILGQKRIIRDGKVLFIGCAGEVWAWLAEDEGEANP